jgi:hypothetical protein
VPLMRSLWLAKRGPNGRSVALRLVPDKKKKRVDFEIIQKRGGKWAVQKDEGRRRKDESSSFIPQPSSFDGTVKRGSATCPVCSYTTPVARVRVQLKTRRGGANDARSPMNKGVSIVCLPSATSTQCGKQQRNWSGGSKPTLGR